MKSSNNADNLIKYLRANKPIDREEEGLLMLEISDLIAQGYKNFSFKNHNLLIQLTDFKGLPKAQKSRVVHFERVVGRIGTREIQ